MYPRISALGGSGKSLDVESGLGGVRLCPSDLKKGIRGGGPGPGIVTKVGFGKPGPQSRKAQGGAWTPGSELSAPAGKAPG